MKDTIKENLERKFNALLSHKKGEHFASFELDYVEYLAKIDGIGIIMEALFNEGRINKSILTHLLKVYFIRIASKKIESGCSDEELIKDFNLPVFITDKIQDELHILESLKEIMDKRLKNSEKTDGWIESFNLANSAYIGENLFVLQKLHNDIMEKMTSESLPRLSNLSFDENKSLLTIGNEEIKIKKLSDQYHLLRIIFENPLETEQEWFFSEITEKTGGGYKDKKYYNAANQIRKKIAVETDIKDFFITTRQSLVINKEYLP